MAKKIKFRSAVTGKFVSAAYAKRYPHLTVGEKTKKAVKKMTVEKYPPFSKKVTSKKNQSLIQMG